MRRERALRAAPRRGASRGLGRALLALCEAKARERGFGAAELMATLPGVRLYRRFSYRAGTPVQHALPNGGSIEFVPMRRELR